MKHSDLKHNLKGKKRVFNYYDVEHNERESKNISKSYGTNRALVDFCADFEPGIYALLGPNGSGKSTLMNIITDNLKADSGEILFSDGEGEPENTLKMGVRFREKLGFMPQYPGMYPNFTVERFMWYMAALKDVGAHLKGRAKKQYIAAQIGEILAAVGKAYNAACFTCRDTDNVSEEYLKERRDICKVKHITCFSNSITCHILKANLIRMIVNFFYFLFFSQEDNPLFIH